MHSLGPDSSAYLIGKAETDRWNFGGLVESRLISWCLNVNIPLPIQTVRLAKDFGGLL